MATKNIYNPTTGQTGYQVPGGALPSGWQWTTTDSPSTGIPSPVSSSPTSSRTSGPTTSYYGQTKNADWEGPALTTESAFLNTLKNTGTIDSGFINSISSDPSIVAFYVNALAYGGYTLGDILNDISRRQLVSQGNAEAQNLKIIDPEKNRTQYLATAEGIKSQTTTASLIPTFGFQGLTNPDILKYGTNMPDELFNELVPIQDPNSQEFKDATAKIMATYFDLSSAQLQATTEQDKAAADYNLQQYKDYINQTYGVQLSNDATTAWNQLEQISTTAAGRGLNPNSGIQNEEVGDYLNGIRKKDQAARAAKLTLEESNKASYYKSSASAAEIAALTPEQKAKYGLTPSADILNAFSIANLKAKNPTWTDAMIQAAHDAVLDESGNYRSTLYQNYYGSLSKNIQTNQTTAENTVKQDILNKEAKAYSAYDTSQVLNVQPSGSGTSSTGPGSTPPSTSSEPTPVEAAAMQKQLDAARAAVAGIQKSLGTSTQSTPVPASAPVPIPTTSTPTPTAPAPYSPTMAWQKANTPTPTTKSGYQGSSIVDYISSTGGDSSYAARAALAAKSGISSYTGSATQNTQLLTKLRGY